MTDVFVRHCGTTSTSQPKDLQTYSPCSHSTELAEHVSAGRSSAELKVHRTNVTTVDKFHAIKCVVEEQYRRTKELEEQESSAVKEASKVNREERWTTDEQKEFISLIKPHIKGRPLGIEEIAMIQAEALEAGLPEGCLDQLLEESEKTVQKKRKKRKKKSSKQKKQEMNKAVEIIEQVDETDNIMAYFSRMASLKEGGHLPRLNTEAIESFVKSSDINQSEQEVEVDLDVGYVNKSLDITLDESCIQQQPTWDSFDGLGKDEDCSSHVSTTIAGRNRYEPMGYCPGEEDKEKADENVFDSLLVGNASIGTSSPGRHVTWNTTIAIKESTDESEETASRSPKKINIASSRTARRSGAVNEHKRLLPGETQDNDWTITDESANDVYAYGYRKDLAEWTRMKNIALWKPNHKRDSTDLFLSLSCHANAEDVVSDEMTGGALGCTQGPSRLRGIAAVRKMMAMTQERRQRQQEINARRHVPKEMASAPKAWTLPYQKRCKDSPGYEGVDQHSLLDSAAVNHAVDPRDDVPWENRFVLQHFLHEQSAVERNWFGRLRRKRGNDPVKFRPARVRSMEMPVEDIDCIHTGGESTTSWTRSKTTNSKATVATKSTFSSKSSKITDASKVTDDGGEKNNTSALTARTLSDDETDFDGNRDRSDQSYSQYSQSVTGTGTTRTGYDASSTLYSEDPFGDGSTLFTADLGLGIMAAGVNNIFDSFLGKPPQPKHKPRIEMDLDEVESTGLSEILDADEDSEDQQVLSKDKYASSFSEASTVVSDRTERNGSAFLSDASGSTSSHSDDDRSRCSRSISSSSYCTSDASSARSENSDCGSWEDAPECGSLINVKPKLGERVSRVTPDHTSHLLRSRFRKKHFPRGSFPYDR